MRKLITYIGIASMLSLLVACPYKSLVPIDVPNVKVDKSLIGKWVKTSDLESDNPNYYQIEKHDKFLYKMVDNTYNSNDSSYSQETYISHVTEINGVIFMNMQKDGAGDYYLHKITHSGKVLTFIEITENIDEKFNTSEELKVFVTKYMDLSFFYTKEEVQYTKQ